MNNAFSSFIALLAILFSPRKAYADTAPPTGIHPTVKVAGAVVVAGAAAWLAIAGPFVTGFEGYARKPYVDTVGTGHPITYCYGATRADGPLPPLSEIFSKEECTEILEKSLQTKYEPEVRRCIHVPLPPHREAALVSFAYNLGSGAVCQIAHYFNSGNYVAGCNAMLAYDHAAGRRLPGLTRRREAERALCLRND